jgi:hypothetical protein
MRIYGSAATATVARPPGAGRAARGGFALPDAGAAHTASPTAGLRAVGGIDALLALQGLEDAGERRKRAVRRGRTALDTLDELKIGLLGGTLSPAILSRLRASAAVLKDRSGEDGLDGVLSEIELRVEVEIAKMAPARG